MLPQVKKAAAHGKHTLTPRTFRVRKDTEGLLIQPPSAPCYIMLNVQKPSVTHSVYVTSSRNILQLPRANGCLPKGAVTDHFLTARVKCVRVEQVWWRTRAIFFPLSSPGTTAELPRTKHWHP